MTLRLGPIGQVALPVRDVDRADAFYGGALGLRHLYRFGRLSFYDCAGVRLLLDEAQEGAAVPASGCLYLRCADIAHTVGLLRDRGIAFDAPPHLIARMDDHDLWMTFFKDPDGNSLALMQEAPKGHDPNH